MRVADIMAREVISIKPDMPVNEALAMLQESKISGLPVIDEAKKLQGMFTEKDILSYVLPSYIKNVGSFVYREDPKAIKEKFSELSRIKVGQLMRKEVIVTQEETTLTEAARIMFTQRVRRVPVVDKTGKVIGIIARCDILRAFSV